MISNSLRLLYSRAGHYPKGLAPLAAEAFSPNTPAGACPRCHGMGRIYDATERSMVPDDSRSIRERAVAAWPPAWHGQNLRDILVSIGYDVDRPWRELPRKDRDWILFTEERPSVPVYAGLTPAQTRRARARKEEPSYQGTFTSARRYVLETFATTESAAIKKRVARYLVSTACPVCRGKRLRPDSLRVKFSGLDISELSAHPIQRVREIVADALGADNATLAELEELHPERALVMRRLGADVIGRIEILESLGLGYLALDRSTPTLSPGELQRLRLATQIRSNLFGVVYVLDEPSAGLHPADTESLLRALDQLKNVGNSVFVVEHEVDVIRHADWIVDIGPGPGEDGGRVLYSGPLPGLESASRSVTRRYLFEAAGSELRQVRSARAWLRMRNASRNNLDDVDVDFPLGALTAVTGISGSGKSTLVSQLLIELVAGHLGHGRDDGNEVPEGALEQATPVTRGGRIVAGLERIKRLVRVDQKPIGRTPRSNLATYTGLFDSVRKLFAATPAARARRYDAGRFSFNVPKGRCSTCEGEGQVSVELIFLASVFAPCPTCHGARYNPQTLEVRYQGKDIAEVLALTVNQACDFFAQAPQVLRSLQVLRDVGVGYLRLGQPATELSGGEAQRIKLATELQRLQQGDALYVLDEPTTGLHPADVEKLLVQLDRLVDAGNTVIVVEHDLKVIAHCDWVVDMGPGAGDRGGRVVASGTPSQIAQTAGSRTAPFLARYLSRAVQRPSRGAHPAAHAR
jgi:excinuclease ABC subunit A